MNLTFLPELPVKITNTAISWDYLVGFIVIFEEIRFYEIEGKYSNS
ncbi:MAG: hypothetical protein K0S44_1724 [Bacteroidetes bacterium]|jgi:hypothetical protein|nr:hypothetical protein [Bacteroidota bacterium]